MIKKLMLILTVFCFVAFKNTTCNYYYNNGYHNYGHYNNTANSYQNLYGEDLRTAIYAISALISYGLHNALCHNKFYQEKLTPLAKKICFFLSGTNLINSVIAPEKNGPLMKLGTLIASGFIAYDLNNMLNKNDVYREEINPFAKKISLFLAGTNMTYISLMFLLKLL